MRFSTWPYPLYLLCFDIGAWQKQQIAQRLLAASREECGSYAWGLKARFRTEGELLSERCCIVLRSDFAQLSLSTDLIERLNAEISARKAHRAPGRSFTQASRESFLRQVATLHRVRGGRSPLQASASDQGPADVVELRPLLEPLEGDRVLPPGMSFSAHAASAPQGGACEVVAGAARPLVVPRAGHMVLAVDPTRVARPVPSGLMLAQGQPRTTSKSGKRQGLSPYMLQLNASLREARLAKGSSLTPLELQQLRASFKESWSRSEGHGAAQEAYQEWQRESLGEASSRGGTVYYPLWGGGCVHTPLCPAEFYSWHQDAGWPPDQQVYAGQHEDTWVGEADLSLLERASRQYQCFSSLRAARNVPRAALPAPLQHDLVVRGL